MINPRNPIVFTFLCVAVMLAITVLIPLYFFWVGDYLHWLFGMEIGQARGLASLLGIISVAAVVMGLCMPFFILWENDK